MSRIITTKHHPIPIPPTLYSTIDSYLPPPEPLKPDIFNPPVFLRTKPRALAPVQKRTQPASFYVVPTLPSLAAMPLAIVKNMMAHLPAEDMVFLSRTCWTLRETIHPVPLAFSTIHTSMWLEDSLRVWELLDDVPAHAAHVREVMLNFTTLGRIPRVALDDEPTGRPEYRDEEGVLLDYDPLDYVKLPEGVTFDHAVMLRAENLLVPALRRMHYLQSFGWYESIADVYAPAEEIFNVLGQHCKRLRALCLKLETKYWPSQAEPFTTLGNLEYVRIMGKLTPYLYRGLETMLLVRCPNLIKLNISIELYENADMSTMFANPAAWPHLTRLTIHGFALDCATYLAFLEGHSLLEELHTDWKLGIDTLDFRKLAPTALPHLQSFTFEHLDSTIAMHLLGHSRPLRRIGKFTMTEKTQPVDLFFAKLAECAPGLEALEIDFSGPQTRVLRSIVEIVSDTLVWLNLGDNSGKRAALPTHFVFPSFPVLRVLLGIYFEPGLVRVCNDENSYLPSPGRRVRLCDVSARSPPVARLRALTQACPRLLLVGYADTGFRNPLGLTFMTRAPFRFVLVLHRDSQGMLQSWRDDWELSDRGPKLPDFQPWFEV